MVRAWLDDALLTVSGQEGCPAGHVVTPMSLWPGGQLAQLGAGVRVVWLRAGAGAGPRGLIRHNAHRRPGALRLELTITGFHSFLVWVCVELKRFVVRCLLLPTLDTAICGAPRAASARAAGCLDVLVLDLDDDDDGEDENEECGHNPGKNPQEWSKLQRHGRFWNWQ